MTDDRDYEDDDPEPDEGALARQLRRWWLDRVEGEITGVVPKAIEYGATDLAEIGRDMANMTGAPKPPGISDNQFYTELGIFFYMRGKVARWLAAIKEGRVASDDTLFDIGIYLKMAQRNRDVGGWPFDPEEDK